VDEVIRDFIGKECVIYTAIAQINGEIVLYSDKWIKVKKDDMYQLVNCDHINRIKEVKRKK